MATFGRPYATGSGSDISINIPKAGSANHAVGADWTPAAGDVKVSIDSGAAANITTLPVAVAMGNSAIWKFVFSDAELTGKMINVTVSDSATKAVDDTGFIIETYGHASAMFPDGPSPADIASAVRTELTTELGNIVSILDDTGTSGVVVAAASKTGYSIASGGVISGAIAAAELNAIADAILDRNMATGTDTGADNTTTRTVRQALRRLRNREAIAAGTGTVYKEDDSTASWTYAATSAAGDPLTEINPT